MKNRRLICVVSVLNPSRLVVPMLAPLLLSGSLHAADQTWIDGNSNNDWSAVALNWDSGIGWVQNNNAIFGGTGETVNLTETISAGSLTFNSGGYIISGNTLTLTGAQTVNVGTGFSTEFTTSIAGGTLNKSGAGTMVLNASNAISTVNVSEGTLKIAGDQTNSRLSNAATVTVGSGATVDFVNTNVTPGGATNSVAVVLNGGTLTSTGGDHSHLRSVTLNAGTWTTGSGASTYEGERWKLWGDVTVGGSARSTISGNGVGLVGARTFNVADATNDGFVDLLVTANLNNGENSTGSLIKAGVGTMSLGSSDYTGTTTVNGGVLLIAGTLRNSSGFSVNSGASLELGATNIFVGTHGDTVNNSRVITVDGGSLLMNSNFEARFGNIDLKNGATWTSNRGVGGWDALLGNTTTGAATIRVSNTSGTAASTMNGSGGIHMQGAQNFDVSNVTGDANADLIVTMILDDGGYNGGTGGVNKLGDGRMSITRQATYTGGTTVTAGTLSLDANGGWAGLIRGTVTVKNGATLQLNANDVTGYGTGSDRVSTINLESGSTMHVSTTQNQTLGSCVINMTGAQITGITNSNLDFFAGGSALNTYASNTSSTISGTKINLRQDSVTFNVEEGGAEYDLDITSRVYGNSLVKSGAGTMRLAGLADYGGTTTINAGNLELHDSVGVTTYYGDQININNGSTLTVSGSRYDFGGKTFNFGSTGGGSVVTRSGVNWVAQGHWTFATNGGAKNTIGGAEGMNLNHFGHSVIFNVARGSDAASDLDVNVGISNTDGGLTKNGDGILTLKGNNTYTGNTVISAGTLYLTGSLANSAVTVSSGATLINNGTIGSSITSSGTVGGTGTFSGAVTINGQLSPGNSPGYQSYGSDLILGSSSTTTFEIGGINRSTINLTGLNYYDAVDVAGVLTLDGTINVVWFNGFSASNGNSFHLFDAVEVNASGFDVNTDLDLPVLAEGLTWDRSSFVSNGVVTVVPEPSSVLLLGVTSLGLALLRKRC